MKTMIVSAAMLIAVATAASAQLRTKSPTMGGWGSGAQTNNIGTGRDSTWQVPPRREFNGYQNPPGSALTGGGGTVGGMRRPLR